MANVVTLTSRDAVAFFRARPRVSRFCRTSRQGDHI